MSNPKHYVDNEKFFKEMKKWKQAVIDAREVDEPDPPSTEYMGECFLKISENLAWRPNFINYTFRDDLVSDGIENCLLYAHNFSPEKSKNPFSYFTQIIHHAYVRRITKEKKQMHLKYLHVERSGIMEQIDVSIEDNKRVTRRYVEYLKTHEKYAENPQPKKPKKRSKLEHFMK
ncbi:MAG: hypothetical protein CL464_11025 [Acidimicrobiaceae bacterium]|nr:hypothetical protein [Acidimicrobiaceae bacterium]|tara:strand:- start:1210 stop:1731 length:522 start_codon:yes stop_codon:yes gene_type:complete